MSRRAMELVFLGTAASTTPRRNSSCVLFKLGDIVHLFDCAEGAFRQLQQTPFSSAKINKIFITHMHGDHLWGLPGFLCAAKFKSTAEIYGPQGIRDWLRMSLNAFGARVSFKYKVHELRLNQEKSLEQVATLHVPSSPHHDELPGYDISCSGDGVWHVLQDEKYEIKAGLLTHNVPCWGYVLQEINERQETGQAGKDCSEAKKIRDGRKVVILGDTSNSDSLLAVAKNADVVVHEACFGKECDKDNHSTPEMAGRFARSIGAKRLVLTHLSRRVATRSLPADEFMKPAQVAFGSNDVVLAEDFLALKVT